MAQLAKTAMGLAIASVKTANDLAVASVKTILGLDNTSGGDVTAPTLSSATVNGTTLTLNWSEAVTGSGAYLAALNVDLSFTGQNIAVSSHTSGNGTATWVMVLASAAVGGDTADLDFTGGANLIEDAAGNDLAAITSAAITNSTATFINENFESGGAGWTADAGTGGVADVAYTASPLSGTKSARCMESSGDASLTYDMGSGKNALSGCFEFKCKSSYSTSNLTSRNILVLQNSGVTILGTVMITTSSSGTVFALNAKMVNTSGTATSATFGLDTKIYVWWQWDNTSDTMTIWWDTVNVRPVGDATKTATSTAAASASVQKVALMSDVANMNHVFDEVKVW